MIKNISLFKLWLMKTNTSIGIIGAGEGGGHKSFATNLLYYQHHSIFTNMKKSSKNQKKERIYSSYMLKNIKIFSG